MKSQLSLYNFDTSATSFNPNGDATPTAFAGSSDTGSRRRLMANLSLAALVMIGSSQAFAQKQIQAKASVNGQVVVDISKKAVVPNATGSAIAAAKIFHPAPKQMGTSYQVNGNAADTKKEAPILDTIANLAEPIAVNAGNIAKQRVFINGTQTRIATCTLPDTVGGAGRPCKVVAKTGSFPLVNKGGAGISSDTGQLQRLDNGNNYEYATALASQKTLNNGMFEVKGNAVTQANPANGLPDPVAVAYDSNRDPMAVYWNAPSNRDFTLDISQLQVNVSTTGPGTAASAFYAIDAAIIDGTTDITLPEGSATPIFSLLLPFNDVDGLAPTINLLAFDLSAAGAISDSLGDVGLVNVANGLLGDLAVVNGTIQFALPYSITVGVPGNNLQSVLFVDTQSFAESTATPEPGTLLLLGSGFLGLGSVVTKRLSQPS